MTTRPERPQNDPKRQEERKKANKEKREEQELQLNDLAIGRRRFALIARIVVFAVVITMAVVGHPHLGNSWIPLMAVGLMRA